MICKGCREETAEEEFYKETQLCPNCFNMEMANEYAQELILFLLKHNIDFKKTDFGSGNGFFLDLEGGIAVNFFYSGRVTFENMGDGK